MMLVSVVLYTSKVTNVSYTFSGPTQLPRLE